MPTEQSAEFRRFTRAVFAAQTAILVHADVANAEIGQGAARWRVLRAIDEGCSTVSDAARLLGLTRQSVQRLVDALVGEGLVSASGPAKEDRRRRTLRLSAAGQRVHDALEANFDEWVERLMIHIPAEDLARVVRDLDRITYVVDADRDYLMRDQPKEQQ